MDDRLTVVFTIRGPLPERDDYPTRSGRRWKITLRESWWVVAGVGLHWPALLTIWHQEPDGLRRPCESYPGNGWRLHVHHWRFQLHPYQALRRRLLTRCAYCGGRSVKGHQVNVRRQYVEPSARWWQGEKGLSHWDCGGEESWAKPQSAS